MTSRVGAFAIRPWLLAAAVVAVFGASAGFGFVRWDDPDYTFRCAFVAGGFSWSNLADAFSRVAANGIWMPLTNLTYMLDVSLFGPGPAGHHAVNVAWHALNAALFWALLRRCFRADAPGAHASAEWACFAAAAFWALHPLRAEAVCWIAARKELAWTCFALLGMLAWLRGRRVCALMCCACACMGKPTAVCLPLLVLAFDSAREPACVKRRWAWYAPLFAMAAATGMLATYSQTHAEGFAVRGLFEADLGWRLLNAAVATGLYVSQTFFPAGIHADYRALPGAFPAHGALGLAALALTVAAVAFFAKKSTSRREILAVAFAGLAALAPTLGVFGSFGESARADRFFYAPGMAISFAFARGLLVLASRLRAPARFFAGAYVSAMALAAVVVAASWRNDLALFSRTLANDPQHPRALAHVASEKCKLADRAVRTAQAGPDAFDEGIAMFRKSMALRPRDNVAAELAYALAARGYASDAVEVRRLAEPLARDPARDRSGVARAALARLATP
ncbi:MAG: hypothetical protein MJ138_00975 [Kiritimatiellae bacterium]|nr:hypothetical protein [Kiritimatiellia bacterium]